MTAEVVLRFREDRFAFEFVERIHPTVFVQALAMCGEESAAERFTTVQIIETFMPPKGLKLRSRVSRFSPAQWAKVVDRTIVGVEQAGDVWFASVGLVAGEPFDHRDQASSLPADYPKSTLKGVMPGPVRMVIALTTDTVTVTLQLDPRRGVDLSPAALWALGLAVIGPVANDDSFELAAVRPDSSSGQDFAIDDLGRPVTIVCGPGLDHAEQATLERAATSVVEAGLIRGLAFRRERGITP